MVVVPLVDHAGAINVESGLPLVDLSGLDVALAFHLPHGWEQCGVIRYVIDVGQLEDFSFKLCIHLTPHCLLELSCARFFHGFVHVHGIRVCRCLVGE